jgi:hypothetical protein
MTHKILLELTDEEYETLADYVNEYHKGKTIEEYLTNTISFYLRIGILKTVYCPYGCKEFSIRIIGITSTILQRLDLKAPDPNIYSTEYVCEQCNKRFWVRRQFGKKEKYVKENHKSS